MYILTLKNIYNHYYYYTFYIFRKKPYFFIKNYKFSEFLENLHEHSLYTTMYTPNIKIKILVHFDPFIYMFKKKPYFHIFPLISAILAAFTQ